jgi:hypothetical protein
MKFGTWHVGTVLARANVDWIQVAQGRVCCEHGNEPSHYTRIEEFQCPDAACQDYCRVVEVRRRFGVTHCLSHQGRRVNQVSRNEQRTSKHSLLFGLLFGREDGSITFLRKVGKLL